MPHSFTLHSQHLVLTMSTANDWLLSRLQGSGAAWGWLGTGLGVNTGSCATDFGTEDARWFLTCGNQAQFFSLCRSDSGATFVRRGAATVFDPSLYIRSAQTGLEVACDDNGTDMGGTDCAGTVPSGTLTDSSQVGPRINNVTVPRGLNAIYLDTAPTPVSAPDTMPYSMVYQIH
jgi:hypothetical protein